MRLTSGTRLGPYDIVAPLGAGGMGEVYRAKDTRLGRDVALKVLPAELAAQPDRLARFQREARTVAALNDPHIVTIHSVEEIDGTHFLTMEVVEGQSLAQALTAGALAIDRLIAIGTALADALAVAHDKGIVHRDLKPANVMITHDGRVKVLDFGLAKETRAADPADATRTSGDRTEFGVVMGTPAYMSPEQVMGRTVDHRTDLFSLGVVLYEAACGSRPFSGASSAELASAILRDDPRPIEALRPDVPAGLARVIASCLEKDPARRVPTARDVGTALRQCTPGSLGSRVVGGSAPSIAVLPFANLSGDPEQDYFSDGLSDEIITALAKVSGLKVTSRTSAFAFNGQNRDVRGIAETLGVANILEGSVRRAGNRIRVTAQLITAADGTHMWSERYDRELQDVFAVQDEIAAAIAQALNVALVPGQSAPRYTPAIAAYEAYLKGHHCQFKMTAEGLALAKPAYEQAIALDPKFAMAHVGLADYYLTVGAVGLMPAREAMPLAREHARRALDIDPSLAAAHGMLAIVAGVFDYYWTEAERQSNRALALAPAGDWVRVWRSGFFYLWFGRYDEAAALCRQALQNDPLSAIFRWNYALALIGAGRVAEGEAEARQILEINEHFWYAGFTVAMVRAQSGDWETALAQARRAHATAPFAPQAIGLLAGVLMRTGAQTEAQALIGALAPTDNMVPTGLAVYYFLAGDLAEAARWIERASDQRDAQLVSLTCLLFGRPFFSSPHWPPLARLMRLPDGPR